MKSSGLAARNRTGSRRKEGREHAEGDGLESAFWSFEIANAPEVFAATGDRRFAPIGSEEIVVWRWRGTRTLL